MVRRQLEPTSIIRVASITTLAVLAPTRTTLRSRKHRQTGGESTTALVATWTVYFPIYLGSNVGNEYAFLAPNKKSAIEYTTPSAYQSTIGIEYQISVNAIPVTRSRAP